MPRPAGVLIACLLTAAGASRAAGQADKAGIEFFEQHVRPVLTDHCVKCHGPTAKKGGLRLDSHAALLAGGEGGPVVKPGDPNASRLIRAVRHVDDDFKMPPPGKLSAQAVAALEKWVAMGVPWPEAVTLVSPDAIARAAKAHWAFQPVKRPPVPKLSTQYSVLSNPIDHFVLAKLAEKKLVLSAEADRRTLIRRVTFDLTGLPPTPAEVAAFEADASPDAYERLLDRLLATPRYGERWARHWLDVARYADNKGYVFFEDKNYPWAWTYRDYVIDAFNRDLPFDRFVLEQIAADRLESGGKKPLAALGFLTVGGHFMGNTHDIIDDRIDVVTRGLMGLTVSCARCHDHKFDPVPQADYYSLYGVFRSCTEPTVPPLLGPAPDTRANRWHAALLAHRERKLVEFVTAKHQELVTQARSRAGEYLFAAYQAASQPPADDFMLLNDKGDLNPAMITRWRAFLDETKKRRNPVWRPWIAFAELPEKEFAAKAGTPTVDDGVNPRVKAAFATKPASMKEVAERYGELLTGVEREWRQAVLTAAWRRQPPPTRLADPAAEELRGVLYGPRSPADAPMELDWGFLSLFPDRATQAEYQKLIKDVETLSGKGPPRAMALLDAARPHDTRVFLRGQPNRLGEAVPRQFLHFLEPRRKPFPTGSGRLELAKAIASKDNPLTSRVFVNRVWMHHFGRGLVTTPSDFGLRSDPPSHAELLDWLAAEFVENGWSAKKLHRLILTSATYRQASLDRDDGLAVDSENRLLWKMNRGRLEFEAQHDATLAIAGNLDLKVGGPSVPLFAGRTRRAVYGYVDRLEFPTLLNTFDVPNPATSSPQRTTTTVSPQALYLMNGPFAREAAKRLAAKVLKLKPAERADTLFLTLFARKPTGAERELVADYVAHGPEAERWVDLVHGLLMTNEFAFID